jgi:hypothetical protein
MHDDDSREYPVRCNVTISHRYRYRMSGAEQTSVRKNDLDCHRPGNVLGGGEAGKSCCYWLEWQKTGLEMGKERSWNGE